MITIWDQLFLAFLAGVLGAVVLATLWLRWMFRETRRAIANSRDEMMVSLRESIDRTVKVAVDDAFTAKLSSGFVLPKIDTMVGQGGQGASSVRIIDFGKAP